MGASEEHHAASAGRSKAVAPRSAAVLCGLRAGGGRTGTVGGTKRVTRSSSPPPPRAQLVSTKSRGEVQTRRTTCIGGPQLGQRAARGSGGVRWRRLLARVVLPDPPADGGERDGTAGMEQAAVADVHTAFGHDMREEAPEKLEDVEMGRPEAGTAHFSGGKRNAAVRERDEAVVGDGDLADRGGAGGEGGMAGVVGLRVDVPREGPDLGIALRQEPGVGHGVCEAGAGEGREGCDGDKDGGAGGPPGRAVLGEPPTGHTVREVRVILQLPAPGVEDAGAPRQVGPQAALVGGEAFEGERRGGAQGVVGGTLVRADAGAQGLRDREGPQEVWPGQLCVEVGLKPRRGFVLLTLGAVPVAAGMLDTVVSPTGWTRREAMAVVAAAALWEGAEDLAVCKGQLGGALQGRWSKDGADLAEGCPGRSLPSYVNAVSGGEGREQRRSVERSKLLTAASAAYLNLALEPTPYSLRFASAFRRGSPRAVSPLSLQRGKPLLLKHPCTRRGKLIPVQRVRTAA
jgi:hypothetical protein